MSKAETYAFEQLVPHYPNIIRYGLGKQIQKIREGFNEDDSIMDIPNIHLKIRPDATLLRHTDCYGDDIVILELFEIEDSCPLTKLKVMDMTEFAQTLFELTEVYVFLHIYDNICSPGHKGVMLADPYTGFDVAHGAIIWHSLHPAGGGRLK